MPGKAAIAASTLPGAISCTQATLSGHVSATREEIKELFDDKYMLMVRTDDRDSVAKA